MIQNNFVMDKLRMLGINLQKQIEQPAGSIGALEYVPCAYKTTNTPPQTGWKPFLPGDRVEGRDTHFWFRASFRTPAAQQAHKLWLHVHTGYEGKWDATNPQGLVYLNGIMTQSLDTNHTEVLLQPDTDYVLWVYFYVGMIESKVDFLPELIWTDNRIEKLYYDIQVPYEACKCLPSDGELFARVTPVLEQAANLVLMRIPYSTEYYESIERADAFLQEEFYGKLCGSSSAIVDCIGHTHIDVAWLWTLDQTREKAQRTFSTMLRLMEEYPEFKFMSSQPQLYQYVKESAPEIYAQIKQRVAEGRWEVEGAMWLEADCNLISGESMVRQILHGKKFMQEEFGVDSRVLWLPDVFGYSAAMPQILKKCGVDHFVTSKISWNETNRLPVDTFLWQGIDGTEIRTDFLTAQDHGKKDTFFTTYNADPTPSQVLGTWENYRQKEYNNETIITFGYGDGGGGSTRKMLEYQRRTAYGLPGFPKTEIRTAGEHLTNVWANMEQNAPKLRRMPKWVGELYLEFHRGTYTSNAKNKRNNRKCELLLQKAETLSALDLLGGGAYPSQELYHAWESVLLHQFHDIIPGSSIKEVYDESDVAYAAVYQTGNRIAEEKLTALANTVNAQNGLLVYNPLGFAATGTVQVDGRTVESGEIPAFGWKVLTPSAECRVTVSDRIAENEYYRVVLDDSGRIASLFDKTAAREVFRAGCVGNELQAFEDFPRQYDAWEITNYYKQKMWILDDEAQIQPVTDGSRAGFRITKKYLNSTICQTLWLYSASRRIDIENEIDWHERHQLLKASFPFDLHALKATYEIQFGNTERPTTENTSWEAAKFEVCGQKWADMSENGYGVSLLNDCKYGFSAEENTMKLTLLKCATYPNPEADQGLHVFTYSLLPHSGDYRDAHTVREAYQLNQPLVSVPVTPHDTVSRPAEYSLLHCDCENVVIETVKKAETGDDLIVRMYEAFDRRSSITLTFGFDVSAVSVCDMLENAEQALPVTNRSVTLPIRNFEIVTLRVHRA